MVTVVVMMLLVVVVSSSSPEAVEVATVPSIPSPVVWDMTPGAQCSFHIDTIRCILI